MAEIPELLVTEGPLKGRRFTVPPGGLKLGRASSCDIAIVDEALSRNNSLFEIRGDVLWVVDLASANGTEVNGEAVTECALKPGDRIVVGDSALDVVAPGASAVAPAGAAGAPPDGAAVDLGFTKDDGASAAPKKGAPLRAILWGVCGLAVVASAAAILLTPSGRTVDTPKALARPRLVSLEYEKVEADTNGIFRYAMNIDAKGVLRVVIDDVPVEDRHVNKSKTLATNAIDRLVQSLDASGLFTLDPEYTGVAAHPGELHSCRIRVVRGEKVFETSIENGNEPEIFKSVRAALEAFSKNELGIWAIQYSKDKLLAMSAEAAKVGDGKWDERDVQYGNIAAAIKSYREAAFYLETINPKPDGYSALVERLQAAEAELDKRYKDQRFLADRAIRLEDWDAARRELRILCDLVPDDQDDRHVEASAKLLDVEARMKKGARK